MTGQEEEQGRAQGACRTSTFVVVKCLDPSMGNMNDEEVRSLFRRLSCLIAFETSTEYIKSLNHDDFSQVC